MATYIPNASDATQPTEEKTVESAALEFRTLKAASSKSLAVPESGVSAVPAAAVRAGKILAFDSVGNPTVATLGTSSDPSLRADLAAVGGESLVHGLVGENSTITSITNLTSINGGQLGGFRNKIINGAMQVWQRGLSWTFTGTSGPTAHDWTADRWVVGKEGAGTMTVSLGQDVQPGYSANGEYMLINSTGMTMGFISQRIEGVRTFAGLTCTLSYIYNVLSGANTGAVPYLSQVFGAGGSGEVGFQAVADITENLGGTTRRRKLTFNVPSVAGKTIGTGSYLKLIVPLEGTMYAAFQSFQLELGSVATPFEQRPYGLELSLCERYYRLAQFSTGVFTSATTAVLGTPHSGMRAAPTPAINSAATVSSGSTNFWQSSANIGTFSNTSDAGAYQLTNFTGAIAATPAILIIGTISLNSEL